jgi:hypothetical protein
MIFSWLIGLTGWFAKKKKIETGLSGSTNSICKALHGTEFALM